MSQVELSHEHHRRRIRWGARGISWVLAPLFIISLAAWLLYNMIACSAMPHSWIERVMCQYSHALPDLVGVLIVGNLIWLGYVLVAYAHEVIAEETLAAEQGPVRLARIAQRSYGALDDEHRSIVLVAMEMTVWSTALLAGILVFYRYEWGQVLGVVAIAALVRIAVALIRRVIAMTSGSGTAPPPPTATASGP